MFIVLINGSPNEGGNTAYLLEIMLKELEEKGVNVEMVSASQVMSQQEQPFCIACSSPCSGVCYEGTELEEVYQKMSQADAIILGSPVYFGTVSAQLKAFWDKSRKLRTEKKLVNKVGAAVSCGRSRFGGQETTIKALYDMLVVQGFTVVGDGHYHADAGHHGACGQHPSREDEFASQRAIILAQRVWEVAQATSSLRKV